MSRFRVRGFTLIEMIVVLVVIAVSVTALLGVFTKSSANSADPLLQEQAVAIAQGYLEEALLKAYQDPDQAETGCEEGSRSNYDDVPDYDCINDMAGALDMFGATLAGLEAYNVEVTVTDVNLGGGANLAPARRVQVSVTHDVSNVRVDLIGHRALIN